MAIEDVDSLPVRGGLVIESAPIINSNWNSKGLSRSAIAVELTPNEYKKMQKHRETYKICVVTRTLEAPTLTVFSFKRANDRWESRDGRILDIKEATGARCRA